MQKKLKSDHIGLSYGPKQVENGPNLRFFATFGHLATPRRPYTPVITSRHISYMISDMSEHYSDHFRGVSRQFKGPREPKNWIFKVFDTFHNVPTPIMAQGPVITNILIQYTFSDMSVHYSMHFWVVLGWFEAPTEPNNCHFQGFWQVPRCGDPDNGSGTHNYSYTHPIHILRHVWALFRPFQRCFGLIWGSKRTEKLWFF